MKITQFQARLSLPESRGGDRKSALRRAGTKLAVVTERPFVLCCPLSFDRVTDLPVRVASLETYPLPLRCRSNS
jgi:hypothetical protein